MKRFLIAGLSAVLLLTLALSFASCETGTGKDTTSLISTDTPPDTTAPDSETEHTHSYTSSVTAPTCTEKGFTTYTCSCGDTYVDDPTDALGHSYGEWVTTKAATCTEVGTETRTCTICGETETREIPIAAHQYKSVVTPPTRTEKGYTTHTCTVCGSASYVDNYTNPTGTTGLSYKTNTDGSITITGYGSATDEDVIIYSTYYVLDSAGNTSSKMVTAIAAGAFMNNDKIKSFAIPASVTTIGEGAFAGCTKLTSFTVESDSKDFSTVGGVLMSKDGATIVAYPAGLSLTSFTISNSIVNIRPSAFAGCANLTKFEIASGHAKYALIDEILYNSEKTELIAYPSGKSLTLLSIPSSVEKIGRYAFFNAKKLSAVSMPDRAYASDNTTITVTGITSIGDYAFYGCSGITTIDLPNITSVLGEYAFAYCSNLANITFGNKLTAISAHSFEGCGDIVNLTIPSTVTSIEPYAFYECVGLVNVVIGSGVKTIGEYAFYNCTGMTSLLIGKNIETIGYRAFVGSLNKGNDTNGNPIAKVYYEGTSDKWFGSTINVDSSNSMYLTIYATIHFYRETNPGTGNYWYYDNGTPKAY